MIFFAMVTARINSQYRPILHARNSFAFIVTLILSFLSGWGMMAITIWAIFKLKWYLCILIIFSIAYLVAYFRRKGEGVFEKTIYFGFPFFMVYNTLQVVAVSMAGILVYFYLI